MPDEWYIYLFPENSIWWLMQIGLGEDLHEMWRPVFCDIYPLTLVLLNPDISAFANSVDQEANWSGSALFAIKYVNI